MAEPDPLSAYAGRLTPFLWKGEDLAEVVEVSARLATTATRGVLAVTNLRVLILMEMRPGGGLDFKRTLRTYSFRHRSLTDVVRSGPSLRLQSPEHAVDLIVAEGSGGAAAAERVEAHIRKNGGGRGDRGGTPRPGPPPVPPAPPTP